MLDRLRRRLEEARVERGDLKEVVPSLQEATLGVQSPLERLEDALHPFVSFVVMPVFALANAGVALDGPLLESAKVGVLGGSLIAGVLGVTLIARSLPRPTPGVPSSR